MESIRLNLGSGGRKLENFINVDIRTQFEPDVVADICNLPFPDGAAHVIRMDAVYEHIWPHKREQAIKEWCRVLSIGGLLFINHIPNFISIVGLWLDGECNLEMVRRQLYGAAPKDIPSLHKDLFTTVKVRKELEANGFGRVHIVKAPYEMNVQAEKCFS